MPDQTPAQTLRAAARLLNRHADDDTPFTLTTAATGTLGDWLGSLTGIEAALTVREHGSLAQEYEHALAVARALLGGPS